MQNHSYNYSHFLADEEKEKTKKLHEHMGSPLTINYGAFEGEEFVGWSFGFQENRRKFYMCNSAVFPEHRRKGLYTALMTKVRDTAVELGFQEIYSRHCATNNAVIIPKLKAGFKITTMEMSDTFGVLIHLTYLPHHLRQKVLDYRCGQAAPDDEVKKAFNL